MRVQDCPTPGAAIDRLPGLVPAILEWQTPGATIDGWPGLVPALLWCPTPGAAIDGRPARVPAILRPSSVLRRLTIAACDHLEAIAIAAVLALLLAFTALDLSGHRLFVVSGSSMEPAVARGSLIVVRPVLPETLAVGDVVTFTHRGTTVTHRVAGIDERTGARIFTTKGDANDTADPDAVAFDDRVGLLVGQVPLAGYVLALLQYSGRPLSVVLGVVIAAWTLRRYRRRTFLFSRDDARASAQAPLFRPHAAGASTQAPRDGWDPDLVRA